MRRGWRGRNLAYFRWRDREWRVIWTAFRRGHPPSCRTEDYGLCDPLPRDGRGPAVYINSLYSPREQRATLIGELGHVVEAVSVITRYDHPTMHARLEGVLEIMRENPWLSKYLLS